MPSYRFSENASADLKNIANYTLKSWGAAQTIAYLDGLEETAKQLAHSPKFGKARNDLAQGLRSFQYQSHVIYYLEENLGIVIARVLHERMSASLHIDPTVGGEGNA
jgi:toxin ParE1/3/4